ncbi:MAG: cadmium-translocating P-type ATPase [Alloprevotella sp.]|nr:cadmium-translocating P-type ATPase [Alloprevotella sp.]MBR1653130.1 cadmium-translocating P-type ATPase [Alloprevotella sp.]
MRRGLLQVCAAALLLAAAYAVQRTLQLPTWQLLLVYLVPYLIAGGGTLREAAEGILHGDVFNEHFLMTVATVGALAIGFLPGAETEFPEAVFVMLFFQVGEMLEGYAEGRSRRSISGLMEIRPDVAHVESSGTETDAAPSEVAVGSIVVVRPGERIPLDGIVVQGRSSLDTVALTGESLPRDVEEGESVASGCVNLNGVLRIRTTKGYGESTATKIIELVENAAERKSRSEAFITRFARIYTPIVVGAALLLAFLPPFFATSYAEALPTWIYRALMFLIVSCPCALVISVPLTFFGGIGAASRRGILIKGSAYIDLLARLNTIVFDKTGTLTRGRFSVTAVHPKDIDAEGLLHLAAHVEHFSTHPIGAALREAFPEEATDGCSITDVEEIAGQGVRARVGDKVVCVGNAKMMEAIGAEWRDCSHVGTIVHVAIDGTYAGHIVCGDTPREGSEGAVAALRAEGIRRIVMLTGDRREVANEVAGRLGITEYFSQLLPADKVQHVEQLMRDGEAGHLAFVGDGINDAPVLARADVGIAMGGLGSDAAIEAADVVLMDDNPMKLPAAVSISRRTLRIARQNIVLAIGVKLAVLLLAAFGVAAMWMAVFADVGVMLLCIINALRLQGIRFLKHEG